ncbi:MAG: GlsB/YeaQ/YmgE family stress response membrane protein [Porticoccus sp.]|nr:GlsB/YeaQ/YmgE family stress response membrane protein [Porticoccus sp.]
MESLIPLVIQLVSGAVGGNVAGSMMKKLSLGTIGNSIVGILGGGLGGQLLGMLGVATGGDGMDIASIVGSLASGGVGGGVLMAVIGVIKNSMGK